MLRLYDSRAEFWQDHYRMTIIVCGYPKAPTLLRFTALLDEPCSGNSSASCRRRRLPRYDKSIGRKRGEPRMLKEALQLFGPSRFQKLGIGQLESE